MAATTMTPTLAANPMQAPEDAVPLKTWICVMGVLLGCFMAVLDIIVTNSSLRDIAGTLSASSDEIMGTNGISGCRDCSDFANVVALSGVFTEEISSGELDPVYYLLCLLRSDTFSWSDDPLSCLAGFHRRRTYSSLFRRHPYLSSALEACNWHGALHCYGNFRACLRAAPRRMADRQLRMAIHLLHKHCPRNTADLSGVVHHGNAANESGPIEKR